MSNHSPMVFNDDTKAGIASALNEPVAALERVYEALTRYEKTPPMVYIIKADRTGHWSMAKAPRFNKSWRFIGKEDPNTFVSVRSISNRKK